MRELWKKRENGRKAKEKLEEEKEWLLQEWENEWKRLPMLKNKEYNEHFGNLFKGTYEYVQYKREINKFKNFLWKGFFLIVLFAGLFIGLISGLHFFIPEGNNLAVTGRGVLYLAVVFSLVFLISKWIDIKKYQETWARHSQHHYLLEQELLKFIFDLEPYGGGNKKEKFIESVQRIWEGNQKKFTENMTNKEKELTDVFSKIKK